MEVVTLVAGAALAPLFESLFASLKSSDLLNFARESEVSQELGKWETMLRTIYEVLNNAEEQQRTNKSVQIWFNNLRNLAYDAEDILDEFNTEAGRLKLREESKASSSKVRKLIRSCVARSGFGSRAKFISRMVSEVKKISERLENIKEQMNILKLSVEGKNSRVREDRTSLPTSSLVNKAQIYGREEDRQRIFDRLKVEAGDGETPVIPIVGMGGVGKTTLAQLVYNEESLQFDFKAWVTVGEGFDVLLITTEIVQQLGGAISNNLNSLQVTLKEKLSNKKALVVLDDVWIDKKDYSQWTLFYSPFAAKTPGSRIIVTTRNEIVSRITSAADGYPLQGLSSDDCLSVLAYHALRRKDFSQHLHLKGVGEKFVEKCDGLPLAAKALGGVLRGQQNVSSWEEVLSSNIWEEGNIVLPALKLSYHHLPSHLKRCFGYTAIFSKDYEFDKTRLVLLWMGEGFVPQMNDGYKYFDDLFERSLFQKSSKDKSLFVMHDLVNDLARSVSGNICFNLDEEVKAEKPYAEVRHSAFSCSEYEIASRFERFHEMKHLRTFVALRLKYLLSYSSPTVLDVMIQKLMCLRLRVLALPYAISELPASIDCLKHLRHLDLSNAQIELLPDSLSKLFNLQALILYCCIRLRKLPKDFCNLINLQCLDIRETISLQEMPLHIGNLKKLQTLGKFIVGNSEGCGIAELLKIPNLQGQLHILGLQNVINIQGVEHTKMRQKEGIYELTLEWADKFDGSRNGRNDLEVLIALEPHTNIEKLSMKSYEGKLFPSWIGDPSFDKMTFLELCNCRNVVSLPPLGQLPSLEELTLKDLNGVKEVGIGFYGNVPSSASVFPSLKILRIKNMEELDQWSHYSIDEGGGQVFPKLKELRIVDCPKLVGSLPKHLPALELLKVRRCALLEVLPEKLPSLGELVVEGCKEVVLRSVPNLDSLTMLEISSISGLVSFNVAFLEALVSLQKMKVRSCDELVSLVEGEEGNFLPNLQVLDVSDCEKLEKLPKGIIVDGNDNSYRHHMSQIEYLNIRSCDSLILPSNGGFPASLRRLFITGPLEAQLFRSLQVQNGLSHLTALQISNCPKLESFPDTGLPIPALLSLGLYGCEKLRSLPNHMDDLMSLRSLYIDDCPEVASFPRGGLPPSLKQLEIRYCDKLGGKLMSERSLNALTCLEELAIVVSGGMKEVKSFPDDSLLLPTSLTHLWIKGFQNLTSISRGLQRLTSLQILSIVGCPQLQSLPRGGLPPSLGCLHIYQCPLLEKRCTKREGVLWHLIATVPHISNDRDYYPSW